ncbi:MAG: efflux RND transporter periplasmic adaptor subunit [Mariprofundus sp.]
MKIWPLLILTALIITACGDEKASGEVAGGESESVSVTVRTVKITTALSRQQDVEITETALGRIIDPVASTIGAELPGRVVEVRVDAGESVHKGQLLALLDAADATAAAATTEAELKRLQAQQQTQQKLVERYRTMIARKFISPTLLEQAEAQLNVLQQGVKAARARLHQAQHNLQRTRVIAPVDGQIEQRLVAAGDYIGLGKPLFRMASGKRLTVSIALPETRAARIKQGQVVRLHLPANAQMVVANITDLTPMVGRSNAFEARVELDNPGHWRPGGSVTARIVTATHRGAVVVPEECVVLRPAGSVVYQIEQGIARALPVVAGVHLDGFVELLSGVATGIVLAADGAAYLSDGAAVQLMQNSESGQ